MVAMNAIDRHPSSEGAPGNGAIVGEIPGGLHHAVARDGSRPGFGPPAFVNRMVRRWISRQAFGTERFSSPAE
jgi:hypothetical protein